MNENNAPPSWWRSLKNWNDIAAIVQAAAAVAAVIGAGTYFLIQERGSQKVNITHQITHRQLTDQWVWILIKTQMENVGEVPIEFGHFYISIQRVLPLEPEFKQSISDGITIVDKNEGRVLWKRIGNAYEGEPKIQMKPGENDYLEHEFIVPTFLKTVRIQTILAESEEATNLYRENSIYDLN